LESARVKNSDEVRKLMWMVVDVEKMQERLKGSEHPEIIQAVQHMRKALLRALRRSCYSEAVQCSFGYPPFESLSIEEILCNFVVFQNESKQR
uniref:PCAF_N domain-containing protein n=1 Tax=Gongylonema pulchrum TaxID=637853 RepID=A0A183EMW7_9BILA